MGSLSSLVHHSGLHSKLIQSLTKTRPAMRTYVFLAALYVVFQAISALSPPEPTEIKENVCEYKEHKGHQILRGTCWKSMETLAACQDKCANHPRQKCYGVDWNRAEKPYRNCRCWLHMKPIKQDRSAAGNIIGLLENPNVDHHQPSNCRELIAVADPAIPVADPDPAIPIPIEALNNLPAHIQAALLAKLGIG